MFGDLDVARFRLQRHHLASTARPDAVTICRDVCGLQAQIMSAAFLQAWARNHHITRGDIEDALWKKRTLVKTSLMRQTIHLIPADQFPVYIAALKSSRTEGALRVMRRCGIGDEEAATLTLIIMEILSAGPQSRSAIDAAVRPRVSKRVRWWMDRVWSIVRIPVAEGLICYGPGEGNEAAFIRSDQWLVAKAPPVSEEQARVRLFRWYLGAYGPATVRDFSHWAGMPAAQVRQLPVEIASELEEVKIRDAVCFVLRNDIAFLRSRSDGPSPVRLLPHFDPYLLAHREKAHLIDTHNYKRVYRNQGWISPVILVDGAIAGIWNHKLQGKNVSVEVQPFEKLTRAVRKTVEQEAESLAGFLGGTLKGCRTGKG